ncbi:hypothetical protein F6455_06815 [Proteobacteria bacterium 005FR1]|nr:hypothetical protein [Proteobacteria bacterium 005FR1]
MLVLLGSVSLGLDAAESIEITDETFGCVREMTPVRGFFVDNLLGDLDSTLAVANSAEGGVYPAGSVVQLVPTEVMVKQPEGSSPATKDWEFFELTVTKEGSKIAKRGYADVVNRFGGNCLACHAQAKPQWDMICEQDHGCAPLPISRATISAIQKTDPRCSVVAPLSDEEKQALMALQRANGGN